VSDRQRPRWFGKKENWLGFGPLTWQGRSTTFLYVFLVVVAVIIYNSLSLTALVIALYTVAYVLTVAFTSDLLDNWPPGS
jgi:hypothetical protein